jgi:hypothetical protein
MRKETDPNSSGRYQLGQLLFITGRFDEARQLYEGVLAAESGKGLIYYEIIKENIERQSNTIRKHWTSTKKLSLRIILI